MEKQSEDIKDMESQEVENTNLEDTELNQQIETQENLSAEDKVNVKDDSNKKSGLFGKKDKKSKQCCDEDLKQEIDKLQSDNAELQDKFLRLYSEFDNYRKRTQKEKLDVIQNAAESIITNLLPILDDMERAIKYGESDNVDLNFVKEGEVLIFQKLTKLLQQKGLKTIDINDACFDTDYHEAISIIPTEKEENKGKIVEEIEKGYMLNDKVIRFSKVVIYQ